MSMMEGELLMVSRVEERGLENVDDTEASPTLEVEWMKHGSLVETGMCLSRMKVRPEFWIG